MSSTEEDKDTRGGVLEPDAVPATPPVIVATSAGDQQRGRFGKGELGDQSKKYAEAAPPRPNQQQPNTPEENLSDVPPPPVLGVFKASPTAKLSGKKSSVPHSQSDGPPPSANEANKAARKDASTAASDSERPVLSPDFFPYGQANFKRLRQDGCFWADNSSFIFDVVETRTAHQLFLRPPRWGKSLFVDMLHRYLDIKTSDDEFDQLFGGTTLLDKHPKQSLKHKRAYHVMRFDFSVDVTNMDVKALKEEFDQEIENSVDNFCNTYQVDVSTRTSALAKLKSVIQNAIVQGANVFILIDEYDRFANKLMFEHPDAYDKIVAGKDEKFSSPIRSFFEAIKSKSEVRTFTVGLSPIAIADASGANNLRHLTQDPCFANMLGFTEPQVKCALEMLFEEKDVQTALNVAKEYFNGYHFPYDTIHSPGESMYTPQLCLHFFEKCCHPSFRQAVLDGSFSHSHMTDPNVKVSDNIVTLLSKHPELPLLFASLASAGGIQGATVQESFKLHQLTTSPGTDLPVSFMVWHGLLTRGTTANGGDNSSFVIPNKIMGDPKDLSYGLLTEFYRGRIRGDIDVFDVVQNPTEEKLWGLLTASLAHVESTFDNTVGELSIQGLVEQFLRCKGGGVQVEVEHTLPDYKRLDMCLRDPTSNSRLLIEFKRLRPPSARNTGCLKLQKPLAATTASEARNQLEKEEIEPSKRQFHSKAGTVGELETNAMAQCRAYKASLQQTTQSTIRCATAVHATTSRGSGAAATYTSIFLVKVETLF